MSNTHLWAKRLTQAVVAASALLGIAWSGQAVAHAGTLAIPDISEWQGKLTANQVSNLKSQVSFVINRRQYGSSYKDLYATNNTALYVKYGIPFGEYDYARFTSVASAKTEAKDFYNRSNKSAKFYVLDFEENDVSSGTTNAAVKAWYNEMRSLTNKNLVFYSYQSFATSYANTARQKFDAQWIANYSTTPTISYALWQYTDHNYLSALSEYTDNSRAVTTVHPINWWTDGMTTALTPVTYAYSKYNAGQHVYLHKGASKYQDGTAIASSDRQKFYKISKVKRLTQSKSKQALYIGALGKWVLSQDATGFWVGQHGSFNLIHKLNIYSDASLSKKTGSYYVSGDKVAGKVVKAPSGKSYRIKTNLGYISANTRFSNHAYYESVAASKTLTTKKKLYEYQKSSFAKSSRSKAVTKGTKLKVTAMKKRSTGSRYFVLSNGKYVTALRSYVKE
ncbi:Lyzozyme M1 (1,4-beta-N-acetylmuramidase) [Levilactobacillus senmaizukei DSM 21775 = NBRC 103853]|uniref:Lyzozyme M1 (1,4-beta-N-acetylmuramidase) n=1 Tax=Levilactobacillus senmaizukei DSM 21775 = NBRC 103853 TaxID=1423803 RepID=A0A0R2DNY1_9LACO|nr:GH25 family lysozyme [Levilactobacillus senmaizukei]KRN01964.1 Lyzozyme M1 (1,4-beta-N-acetylmuramidase) [Levilactobacillus senmaizukei DSM 21775 = NBRC 103853]